MIELGRGIKADRPDASFDLDGTVFKLTIIEEYTLWLSSQGVFEPLPVEITTAKRLWKENNTEANYKAHLDLLVGFFISQIPGKSVTALVEAAKVVAAQQMHRRWNVTDAIKAHAGKTHNLIAVSLMPEWLMEPFVGSLDFVALIGSTYVTHKSAFTGEAHSINKAEVYKAVRPKSKQTLDIHMGDTMGDASLFEVAKRPILFNPSWTLYKKMLSGHPTILTSHKDLVTVLNPVSSDKPSFWGPPLDAKAILAQVRTQDR